MKAEALWPMEHGKPTQQDYSTQVPHSHRHCNLTILRQEERKRSSSKPTVKKRLYIHTYTQTKIHITLKHTQSYAPVNRLQIGVNIHWYTLTEGNTWDSEDQLHPSNYIFRASFSSNSQILQAVTVSSTHVLFNNVLNAESPWVYKIKQTQTTIFKCHTNLNVRFGYTSSTINHISAGLIVWLLSPPLNYSHELL